MKPKAAPLLAILLAQAPLLLAAARPAGPPAVSGPRVIVVGWDGADWRLLDALLAAGRLPNLRALLAEGRSAVLETYRPRASPLLWTTVATGLTPLEHGVADFQEWDEAARAVLPISGRSRRSPAIWNLASARGRKVGVVGWWATWPAEVVNGFFVSDRASPVLFDPALLSASPALTWPAELAEGVRLVGRREGRPSFEEVAKFLKVTREELEAATVRGDDLKDPIVGFQKILGSTRVYARTALELYDRQRPDLLLVYFEGTDEVGHVLGKYHPPLLPGVDAAGFAKFRDGVSLYYQEVDRILGEFATRAKRDGAALVLLSDHGFNWGPDRPVLASSIETDTAYLWHEPEGILVAAGRGVAPSSARGRASIFDVTPILCRLLGLPPDRRFTGKVPAGFVSKDAPRALAPIAWEREVKVERVRRSANPEADRKAGEEFTKKLISLGYLTGAPSRPAGPAGEGSAEVRQTANAVSNLGVYLAESGKVVESLDYFDRAVKAEPDNATFRTNRADALEKLGRYSASDPDAVRAGALDSQFGTERLIARAAARIAIGKGAEATALLERANAEITPTRPQLLDALVRVYFDQRRCREALAPAERVTVLSPGDAGAFVMLGRVKRCLGDVPGAQAAYARATLLAPADDRIRREAERLR